MASKRQDILDNIEATLNAITEIEEVRMTQPIEVDKDTVGFPFASVWTFSDVPAAQTPIIGQETWDWLIGIEVWFYNDVTNQETLLKTVVDAMYVDTQRGGCALDTKRVLIDHFNVYNDYETSIKGFIVQFRITYLHEYGVM